MAFTLLVASTSVLLAIVQVLVTHLAGQITSIDAALESMRP